MSEGVEKKECSGRQRLFFATTRPFPRLPQLPHVSQDYGSFAKTKPAHLHHLSVAAHIIFAVPRQRDGASANTAAAP